MATQTPSPKSVGPTDEHLLMLGKLNYLAAYCSLHRKFPIGLLDRIFFPAVNHDCVRFFENGQSKTCAALIWARLSDDATQAFLDEQRPPTMDEWNSGSNLWFVDLIAPFGHGLQVARQIARNPPEEQFRFARIDEQGKLRKIVTGDAKAPRHERLRAEVMRPKAA